MVVKIQSAAPVGQPAHDDPVSSDHLLPVDPQVLARLERAARNGEPPGDEGSGIAGPAGLHRQACQIDLVFLPHHFMAGAVGAHARRHVEHLLEQRKLLPQVAQALGRLGLLEIREELAHVAQGARRFHAHGGGDALHRAEKVGEDRHAMSRRPLEEERRPARAQHPIGDLGHLELRRNLGSDSLQLAALLEKREEAAKVTVLHRLRRHQPLADCLGEVEQAGVAAAHRVHALRAGEIEDQRGGAEPAEHRERDAAERGEQSDEGQRVRHRPEEAGTSACSARVTPFASGFGHLSRGRVGELGERPGNGEQHERDDEQRDAPADSARVALVGDAQRCDAASGTVSRCSSLRWMRQLA